MLFNCVTSICSCHAHLINSLSTVCIDYAFKSLMPPAAHIQQMIAIIHKLRLNMPLISVIVTGLGVYNIYSYHSDTMVAMPTSLVTRSR